MPNVIIVQIIINYYWNIIDFTNIYTIYITQTRWHQFLDLKIFLEILKIKLKKNNWIILLYNSTYKLLKLFISLIKGSNRIYNLQIIVMNSINLQIV